MHQLHDEVALQRYMREAQLDHPYAAHVYAFGIDKNAAWIAMELVHSKNLKRWLEAHGPMPLEQLVPFFESIAEVLQAAHDRGIVHRNLKPSRTRSRS